MLTKSNNNSSINDSKKNIHFFSFNEIELLLVFSLLLAEQNANEKRVNEIKYTKNTALENPIWATLITNMNSTQYTHLLTHKWWELIRIVGKISIYGKFTHARDTFFFKKKKSYAIHSGLKECLFVFFPKVIEICVWKTVLFILYM